MNAKQLADKYKQQNYIDTSGNRMNGNELVEFKLMIEHSIFMPM